MSAATTTSSENGRGHGFPFAAVVGMEDVKLALLIGAVEPRLGGILLRGQKGSAKTTLARGLAELLPGEPRPPFVDLPIGSTEDRVVGTLDLASALRDGERRFHPGLLASADGGVLYVDEVNLLPDHLVDVLLDVAASGTNRVERDGVSFEHWSRFFLIGSMNPEEGELRPQLLDRFGLAVDVASPTEPALRSEAVHRRIAFDADPEATVTLWAPVAAEIRARIARAKLRARLGLAEADTVPAAIVDLAVRLAVELGADGLRADLALCRAAVALADLEDRGTPTVDDIYRVAPLALGHRRRRGPFDQPGLSKEELDAAMDRATAALGPSGYKAREHLSASEGPAGDEEEEGAAAPTGPEGDRPRSEAGDSPGADNFSEFSDGAGGASPDAGRTGGQVASPDEPTTLGAPSEGHTAEVLPIRLPPGRRPSAAQPGDTSSPGRARHPSAQAGEGMRRWGRTIGARPAGPRPASIAVAPTALAAATRRRFEGAAAAGLAPEDLHEPVIEPRSSHLVVLCVDSSGSMGAEHRTAAARAAVLGLLTDAYQRRDRVALVTFGGGGARIALQPTASIEIARSRLADLPTGGRTPLGEGILQSLAVCKAPSARGYSPVLVLITDGRATGAPPGLDPVAAAVEAAGKVASSGVAAVLVDVESGDVPLHLGRDIAAAMGARHLRLATVEGTAIEQAVRLVLSEDG
jgi:magnesium chelatase subunit D